MIFRRLRKFNHLHFLLCSGLNQLSLLNNFWGLDNKFIYSAVTILLCNQSNACSIRQVKFEVKPSIIAWLIVAHKSLTLGCSQSVMAAQLLAVRVKQNDVV